MQGFSDVFLCLTHAWSCWNSMLPVEKSLRTFLLDPLFESPLLPKEHGQKFIRGKSSPFTIKSPLVSYFTSTRNWSRKLQRVILPPYVIHALPAFWITKNPGYPPIQLLQGLTLDYFQECNGPTQKNDSGLLWKSLTSMMNWSWPNVAYFLRRWSCHQTSQDN